MKKVFFWIAAITLPLVASASEADLKMPELSFGQRSLLEWGLLICGLGLLFSWYYYRRTKRLEAHSAMLNVSKTIFETCKSYLLQQGKFLIVLFLFIGVCVAFYFGYLRNYPFSGVALILSWTIIGILGSYSVAWFGIRVNTLANSRMAFEALKNRPLKLLGIPLNAGMSIGVLLICIELILMLIILLFIPSQYAGACFIGFAIGESLGASALRIAGGIFTKIADIGSDLMKIVFKIKEDDPRNPGVIADCTGDNAGDSVGPTADGFETYGVTGVALISFIVLAVFPQFQAELITWIFTMRIMMIVTSMLSFYVNGLYSRLLYRHRKDLDFEKPLTSLIWISSILSIAATFLASWVLLHHLPNDLWLYLSGIISCGTLGAALIPEVTKKFTSPKSGHVQEIVKASREGGPSLNILSGLVAGNFSAFWSSLVFVGLMSIAFFLSQQGLGDMMIYPAIFGFGLVAFGFLGMGPVNIAVDSYGPVTDNAQSVFELSEIEKIPEIEKKIERQYDFQPNLERAKYLLECNDGAGNTFKATAKP
ncbi:MAG TPA: sodium-translocating pyrophosphatase, partial [bacterium]|nr:sodium-translocating pyrophosphatase [bacterium]